MLWFIVRILVSRFLKKKAEEGEQPGQETPVVDNSNALVFAHSCRELQKLRSNRDSILPTKIEHYYALVKAFFSPESGFRGEADVDAIVDLICKEEMNSFCLYPKGTSMPGVTRDRGRAYNLGLYTRATWMNHDFEPNVSLLISLRPRSVASSQKLTLSSPDGP